MTLYFNNVHGEINLQSTLSAQSASCDVDRQVHPHHPITCASQLALNNDGSLSCQHATVGPDDPRLQDALNSTIAILILEMAHDAFWAGKI